MIDITYVAAALALTGVAKHWMQYPKSNLDTVSSCVLFIMSVAAYFGAAALLVSVFK